MFGLSPKASFWINAIVGVLCIKNFLTAILFFHISSALLSGVIGGLCLYQIKAQFNAKLYPYFEVQGLKKKLGIK